MHLAKTDSSSAHKRLQGRSSKIEISLFALFTKSFVTKHFNRNALGTQKDRLKYLAGAFKRKLLFSMDFVFVVRCLMQFSILLTL